MSTKILQQDIQNQKYTSGGTGTAYTVTVPNLSALYDGYRVMLKMNTDNTGSATLNVNSIGAKTIKKPDGSNLSAGDLQQDGLYEFAYDSAQDCFFTLDDISSLNIVDGGVAFSQTKTLVAGETINAGDAVCQTVDTYQYTTSSAVVKTASISTTPLQYKFGQAINISTDGYLKSFQCLLNGNGDININSIVCEVYAMTGSLGTTGAPTGPVLYSSRPILWGADIGTNTGTPTILYFTFKDEYIPSGNYCFMIDLTVVDNDFGTTETLEVLGGNPGGASGNFIDVTTPVAGTDMYYILKTNSTLLQTDADVSTRRNFIGFALTGNTVGNSIDVQTEGIVNLSGVVSGNTYYLSSTPGAIGTTNNGYPVGYGLATDNIRLSPTMAGDQFLKSGNSYFYSTVTGIATALIEQGSAGAAAMHVYEGDYDGFSLTNMTLISSCGTVAGVEIGQTILLKKGKWYYFDTSTTGSYAAILIKPIYVYI